MVYLARMGKLRRKSNPFASAMRSDAKSVVVRDRMRKMARGIQRAAAEHVRDDGWKVRIDTDRKLLAQGQRADGWQNTITALGTSRDKRVTGQFWTNRLVDLEAEDIWRGDDMAGRAVETVPNQIVRAGFEMLVKTPTEAEKKQAKTPEEQAKKAKLDYMRSRAGQAWWLQRIDELELASELKESIKKKIRADLASDVFPPDDVSEADASGKEISEAMNALMEDLGVLEKIGEALKAERGYGGAALFPGIRDGVKDLTKPLDYSKIQSVDWLDVLTPLELVPFQWYNDPNKKNYGMPELYWMQRISIGNIGSTARIPIHESRLIFFPGIVVSRRQLREHWGWGDSVLVRMMEVLRDFQTTWQGAAILMTDFAQAVMKIVGLAESFSSGDDADKNILVERATALDLGRSIARATLIDKDEEFERKATPMTGFPDMLDRFCNRLASAAHMPVTILMGQAPAGLNATGDSDIRSFYDNIGANRERQLKPRLNILAKMLFAAKEGPTEGEEPENWSWKFGALWQPTEKEEAERRYIVAQADQIYIDAQVLIPAEVAISRFGGDQYSPETHLNQDARDAYDAQMQAEAEAEAEAKAAQLEAMKTANNTGQGTSPAGEGAPKQPQTSTGPVPKDNGPKTPGPPVPVGKDQQPTTPKEEKAVS